VAFFEVGILRVALEELAAVGTRKDRRLIENRIRALAEDPRSPRCRKVSGRDLWRIRQGRYRIVCRIEEARLAVLVVRVAHRKYANR